LSSFEPLIRNPHLATIASNFWPRYKELERYPVRAVRYETEPGVAVLVHEQRPAGRCRGELVLVHGLEGSSEGGYMLSMAYTALEAGFAVHRVNIRGCGGTEAWCQTLYHAGLTSDLHRILGEIAPRAEGPILLMGYSLGGNVVLKLSGEGGPQKATVAVSTPLDLHACVRALARPQCFLYQNRFINRMRDRLRERARLHPAVFTPLAETAEREKVRTVFAFDDKITAPFFGFGDAPNYYATQSAQNYLGKISTPTLLITAQDDPLVPFAIYAHPAIAANPRIELIAPRHGGHVAFLAKGKPRFWVDATALAWLESYGNK
jgi:predicted alpha/beta-fold hydrolase